MKFARERGKEEKKRCHVGTRVAPRPRDDLSYRGIVYVRALCLARDTYADSRSLPLFNLIIGKKKKEKNAACVVYASHFPFSA